MKYNIIVVGGGHAGCEAALSCARMGQKTLLITGNINNIADMPCNPSIGGPAKGIVVREIDALGGEMGKNTDKSLLQLKMLNTKKGPAVQALRAQADKIMYPKEMLKTLQSQENLEIQENLVGELLTKDNKITGLKLEDGTTIEAQAVILTTGTYLKAMILVGDTKQSNGPHGEKPSRYLSDSLNKLGFTLLRLKTGTPPRIAKESIDFSKMTIQEGDKEIVPFSFENNNLDIEQVPCYLTYTNEKTHEIIRKNLHRSPLYAGKIEGTGPRYCPSIEDKVVRFSDKERHQIFIEPMGLNTEEMYVQGMSSSLPEDVQIAMYRTIPGLENAEFVKYGVMHRNSYINSPMLLDNTYNLKENTNVYFAGQITGIEGYMESASSGILAGINAVYRKRGLNPLILPKETMMGALSNYVANSISDDYQPMGANFGVLPPLEQQIRDKKERYAALAQRSLTLLEAFIVNG